MAIDLFSFRKRWTNPEDFPTFETDETKVREDMQELFDELAAYINYTVRPRVNADAEGLQTAQAAIADLVAVSVPDNSLSAAKFQNGGAAGWELLLHSELEPAIITNVDGTLVKGLTLFNWEFRYSRALGIMAYSYWLDAEVTGRADVRMRHTNYRADSDTEQVANVFTWSPTEGVLAQASCYDVPSQAYTEHLIYIEGAFTGQIKVSGWYFCDGPSEEES